MPHVNCQTVELEEWWFGGFCSQRTWAPYSHCVDHVLFCLLPQAVLWCQEQGPWGWLRFAVHCYGSLGLLPFGLDAPSGAFFLLLLGLACSCHWDVWHWSFSTHRELCRVWVSWVFCSLPLTLGGASFSVKGTHTQTVMQDCSCVSDFLFRFFFEGGGGCIVLFTFTFSYTGFWLNFCWHCEICCMLFILRIGNWLCSCFFLVFFSVFEPLRNKKEGRRWLYV